MEVYRFLRDECRARFIQFIPIVERLHENGVPFGDAVTDRSVTARQYGQFLIDVFEEWLRRDIGEVYVQMFDLVASDKQIKFGRDKYDTLPQYCLDCDVHYQQKDQEWQALLTKTGRTASSTRWQ